jgi:peptidoglycan hydrolase CwlO-like protein
MMQERRSDIGNKLSYVILTALITLMLSTFFYKTYGVAESAMEMANNNRKDIAVLQQCITDISRQLASIDNKLDRIVK